MNARVLALTGLSAATLLLTAVTAAHADDPSSFAEARKYVSFYGQAAIQTLPNDAIGDDTRKGQIQGVTSSGAGGGLGIIAGIRSNAWVGFELEYEFLSGAKLSGCTVRDDKVDQYSGCLGYNGEPGQPRDDRTYLLHNFWFQTKVFPLHSVLDKHMEGRLQPYVKLGGGAMIGVDLDIKTSISFAGRFGGGVDYHVNDNWALGLDVGYMLPAGNISGLSPVTIGLGATYHWY